MAELVPERIEYNHPKIALSSILCIRRPHFYRIMRKIDSLSARREVGVRLSRLPYPMHCTKHALDMSTTYNMRFVRVCSKIVSISIPNLARKQLPHPTLV